jgi:hypothetical protein
MSASEEEYPLQEGANACARARVSRRSVARRVRWRSCVPQAAAKRGNGRDENGRDGDAFYAFCTLHSLRQGQADADPAYGEAAL